MEKKTIEKALNVIDNARQKYQRRLDHIKLKADSEAKDDNANIGECESDIEKYKIVLSDLAIVREAIEQEKDEWCQVMIQGTDDGEAVYYETYCTLQEAGFEIVADSEGLGMILLFPKEES